jgi:PAS domain S-box-containing protein
MEQFQEIIKLLENSKIYYIVTTGLDDNYKYVNTNYSESFSYINNQMVGQPYYITMHPDDRNVCIETSVKCFEYPNKSFPAILRKHDGKGGYIVTLWEFWAIFDDNNQPSGIFCLGHNITEFETAKAELKEKSIVLEQISWDQSHILRRPVANILGLVNILLLMELDQNMVNICTMLADSANQLDTELQAIVNKRNQH